MEATRGQSSTQHPTIMELQRLQLEALQSGDRDRVSELQERIFEKLEDAQAAARFTEAA